MFSYGLAKQYMTLMLMLIKDLKKPHRKHKSVVTYDNILWSCAGPFSICRPSNNIKSISLTFITHLGECDTVFIWHWPHVIILIHIAGFTGTVCGFLTLFIQSACQNAGADILNSHQGTICPHWIIAHSRCRSDTTLVVHVWKMI